MCNECAGVRFKAGGSKPDSVDAVPVQRCKTAPNNKAKQNKKALPMGKALILREVEGDRTPGLRIHKPTL